MLTNYEQLTIEEREQLDKWIRGRLRRSNCMHTAYALKQPFSRELFYVTEEVFAKAMVEAGFPPKGKTLNGKGRFGVRFISPLAKCGERSLEEMIDSDVGRSLSRRSL